MAHEILLNELVEKMRAAAGENLLSVVLFGSAAQGEFHPEYSDVNLLCVLRSRFCRRFRRWSSGGGGSGIGRRW